MNSVIEKEKKLTLALTKLKNLNYKNASIKKNIEDLDEQKNQLEIEKQELEEKYKRLLYEYNTLNGRLGELKNQEKNDIKKQEQFSQKIDELNRETDNLLSEFDKWQM